MERIAALFLRALACATLVLAVGSIAASAQNAKVVAGTLTCEGQGSVGLILGSNEKLRCKFSPTGGRQPSYFDGAITRIGVDLGVRGKSVMIWTVLGATTQLPGQKLGGEFAGVSADVAAGLGVGANVLVGGNDNSVVLQPVSVKGGTGINIAVGVSGMKLVPVN